MDSYNQIDVAKDAPFGKCIDVRFCMRRILIESIKGNELLAKDILNESGMVIISKGTVMKQEYISKLISLGIYDIYVEDKYSEGVHIEDNLEDIIKENYQDIMKAVMDRHTLYSQGDLHHICDVAEEMIGEVLHMPHVLFSISGIRRKSEALYSHSISVCYLSVLIALRMKLSKDKVKEIAIGSLLHDIGYKHLSFDYVSSESNGVILEETKEAMKHVINGYLSLEEETWINSASREIILCHHECIDGSGFPFRKTDKKLKIGSKIVAVCDMFDRSVYGLLAEKLKVHTAIDYIMSNAGIKYDMDVVHIFLECVAAYPNGSGVLTNEGEVGIVLKQNIKFPTRPVIRIIKDKSGNEVEEWVEKDMKKELTLFIVDVVDL